MHAISSESIHNSLLAKKYLKTDYESRLFDPKIIKEYCSLYDSFSSQRRSSFKWIIFENRKISALFSKLLILNEIKGFQHTHRLHSIAIIDFFSNKGFR